MDYVSDNNHIVDVMCGWAIEPACFICVNNNSQS